MWTKRQAEHELAQLKLVSHTEFNFTDPCTFPKLLFLGKVGVGVCYFMDKQRRRCRSIQDHFFVGGCATDTAVTEMMRSYGGKIRRQYHWVVQTVKGRMEGQGTRCFRKGSALDEVARQPSTCPPWKKPRTFWRTGKVSWWQTGTPEDSTEEVWKKGVGVGMGTGRRNKWSRQGRILAFGL